MEIERASFGRQSYSRSLFRELYEQCRGLFFVARRGKHVAGYIVGCVEKAEAEVVSIAVDPAVRQVGVGRVLMEHLVNAASVAGAKRMSLMVRTDNHAALKFYRGFGFRRLRRVPGYYEDGADGWLMYRLL